jgi:hypothetical protein
MPPGAEGRGHGSNKRLFLFAGKKRATLEGRGAAAVFLKPSSMFVQ